MAAGQRLFAINSALTADYAALKAMAFGGQLIDLAHESSKMAEVRLLRESAEVNVVNPAAAGAAEVLLDPQSVYLSAVDGQGSHASGGFSGRKLPTTVPCHAHLG